MNSHRLAISIPLCLAAAVGHIPLSEKQAELVAAAVVLLSLHTAIHCFSMRIAIV